MSGAIHASFLGIPLQYLDEVYMAVGVLFIVVGVWLRYRIVEVRMQTEEDVKNRKISEDQAERHVRNRTRLINLTIVAGMGLTIAAMCLLAVQSELNSVAGQ